MNKFKTVSSKINNLPVIFGGASISGEGGGYGFGDIDESAAISLLSEAFEGGITVYDSAPIYGFGLSEKRMGAAFKNKREDVYLVSKSGVSWHENKRVNMTNDPLVTQKMLEQSLKDFQSDYIDLYMIHWPDKNIDIRFPMEVLAKAKQQQKIRHIGLCNSNPEDFTKACEVVQVDVLQSEYSLIKDKAFDKLDKAITKMGWGTFDKGILTGRVSKNRSYDKSDCRSWAPWWKKSDLDTKLNKVEKIKQRLSSKDIELIDIALHFVLQNDINLTPIIGMKNTQQLNSVIDVLSKKIEPNLIKDCYNLLHDT